MLKNISCHPSHRLFPTLFVEKMWSASHNTFQADNSTQPWGNTPWRNMAVWQCTLHLYLPGGNSIQPWGNRFHYGCAAIRFALVPSRLKLHSTSKDTYTHSLPVAAKEYVFCTSPSSCLRHTHHNALRLGCWLQVISVRADFPCPGLCRLTCLPLVKEQNQQCF